MMEDTCILVADDDPVVVRLLEDYLGDVYRNMVIARDGHETLQTFSQCSPDLVILDILMPGLDGFEVIRQLRKTSVIPVIMLSALGGTEDKVKCLTLGADDYITKPFDIDELIARIMAVLRRSQITNSIQSAPLFTQYGFLIDVQSHRVSVANQELILTATEFNLLKELAYNAEKVLSYEYLLQKVWGPEYGTEREYLHVYINRLRSKLNLFDKTCINIATVSGTGYCLKFQDTKTSEIKVPFHFKWVTQHYYNRAFQ